MADNAGEPATQHTASVLERLNLTGRSWKFYAAASLPPIVAAGLALWYYSARPAEDDKKDDKKKRQRKARKAKKSAKSADGSGTEPMGGSSPEKAGAATLDGDEETPEKLTDAQIAMLDKATAKKMAQSLKSRGNKFFQAKRYEKAIELYTHALRFGKDPVFYSNRAACYAADNDHEKVIQDCTAAVALEPRYVKALMRRALAYESTERFRDSLYDYTTVCILEDFGNNLAAAAAERVLKRLAEAEARERVEKREPRLPSRSFISGYLKSFRSAGEAAVAAEEGEELSEADSLYNEALELTAQQEYAQAIEAIEKAVAAAEAVGCVGVQRADDLYSLRGMFSFLKSNLGQALQDLDKALEINPKHVRSYLRKANVLTEKKDLDEVSRLLDQALEADADNAETYFQKGQTNFLKQEFVEAAKDYQRAGELDEDFVYPRIQLGVVQFKIGRLSEAMATFDAAMKRFPERSDLYNYYGEVLAEQGGSENAISAFEKAVELDPTSPLPYVNQAVALFQTGNDVERALELIRDAFKVDAECELAVAALSQVYLQLGMFEESLTMLRRAVDLAKSEEEMVSAITFRETTAAQHRFMKEHPDVLNKLMGGAM